MRLAPFLPPSYGVLNFYPDGTFTHCSCQPSLDAHLSFLIGPDFLETPSPRSLPATEQFHESATIRPLERGAPIRWLAAKRPHVQSLDCIIDSRLELPQLKGEVRCDAAINPQFHKVLSGRRSVAIVVPLVYAIRRDDLLFDDLAGRSEE